MPGVNPADGGGGEFGHDGVGSNNMKKPMPSSDFGLGPGQLGMNKKSVLPSAGFGGGLAGGSILGGGPHRKTDDFGTSGMGGGVSFLPLLLSFPLLSSRSSLFPLFPCGILCLGSCVEGGPFVGASGGKGGGHV